MSCPTDYWLRRASGADFEFMQLAQQRALGEYVKQVWGWGEVQQNDFFKEHFCPDLVSIIVFQDRDVGYIELVRKEDELFLQNLVLLPEFQRRGIGTRVLSDLIARVNGEKIALTLTVLRVNPAQSLYRRLGFVTIGENDIRFFMKYLPR